MKRCSAGMNPHFRAFSFVDRITHLEPGVSAWGRYTVPAGVVAFPISLAAEAVGQLAAWAAMAALDFQVRPVAGIAGRVELLAPVQPGVALELLADLKTVASDAVAYGGEVRIGGQTVLQLEDCVGPMVSVREFDDPLAVRSRFELLRADGATPGAFTGIAAIPLSRTGGERGQSLSARLEVPAVAPFFGDHFPRRPVFPGTLQMQANLELVSWLAAELTPPTPGISWKPVALSDVKLRTFIAPEDTLELEAKLIALSTDSAIVAVETRRNQRLAGSARVVLKPMEAP
jgi:3-hydroxymyristoyl/3-hydroxydecanoyl-(acyl carrier protein) dehydratase